MRGVKNVHGARRTSATRRAWPMSADWSSAISRAEASAIKSQKAVTSNQKVEESQRCGFGSCPGPGRLGCTGSSSIFPIRDDVEPTEVSLIMIILRERRGEVTRPPCFPPQVWPHSSRSVPASSQSGNLLLSRGVLIYGSREEANEQMPASQCSAGALQIVGHERLLRA